MATISRPYSEVDGAVAEASSINTVIDLPYTEINGNLNSANLLSGAVGNTELQCQSIQYNNLEAGSILAIEVFS